MQPHAAPLEDVQRLLGVLVGLYGLLIAVLALGAFWIRAKFFTPIKFELTQTATAIQAELSETASAIRGEMTSVVADLSIAIEREAASRKMAIFEGVAATNALTAAVKALDITCAELKVGALREAEERGRQAERIHAIANHVTKVDVQLAAHLQQRRIDDPKDGSA